VGGASAAGAEALPKPPGASSISIFDKLYRKVRGWNGTIPKIFRYQLKKEFISMQL